MTSIVSSGSPAPPYRLVTSWPSIVPTVRLTLRIGSSSVTRLAGLERALGELDQRVVERLVQAVVLGRPCGAAALPSGSSGTCRIGDRSSPAAFQWSTAPPRCRGSRRGRSASSSVRKPSSARNSRTSSRDELEEVDDELRLAGEPLAQLGVLRGDADRAGVEVADAHHDAAGHHQRRGREAELLGAEQRGDDDVAAGLELAVGLHDDPVAQPVEQQRLLGLGQAELPGAARVLDRGQRRGAGAAVVAGDQHDVGVRLADARRRPCRPRPRRPASRGRAPAGWRSSGRG